MPFGLRCLNPYSTGSNSNRMRRIYSAMTRVLILILLEVTQMFMDIRNALLHCRLNPYSTGSNSNVKVQETGIKASLS